MEHEDINKEEFDAILALSKTKLKDFLPSIESSLTEEQLDIINKKINKK